MDVSLEPFKYCTLQKTGLSIQDAISREDYLRLGEALHFMQGSIQFWIGDWLRFGEKKWGEMYKEAMEVTGQSYGTLRNFKSISDSVELSRRHDKLSYEHHVAVASLPAQLQEEWLNTAELESLSYRELKEEIKSDAHYKALTAAQNHIDDKKRQELASICDIRLMSCQALFESGIKPDAVITDPPYIKECLPSFSELSKAAQNVPLVAVNVWEYVSSRRMYEIKRIP